MKVYFTEESANSYPDYLTPNKRYDVIENITYNLFIIIDDNESKRFIRVNGCSHLCDGKWIVEK